MAADQSLVNPSQPTTPTKPVNPSQPTTPAKAETTSASSSSAAHVDKSNFLTYFSLNGSATYDKNTGIVTITPDEYNKVGNFSLKSKIDMNTSFTLTGKVNLGSNPNGADGIGFAFHNGNTTDIGNAGGNLGIGGLQNALGFKLDTWTNVYQAPQSDKDGSQIDLTNSNDFGWNGDSMNAPYGTFVDTENEEVATKDGIKVQRWWTKDVGTSQALSKSAIDGQFHDFTVDYDTVDYDGHTRTLTIKYTQTSGKILTWTTTVSNSNQAMAMIVSASTGGAKNLHQFEIMSFDFKQAATVNVKYVDTKGNQIAQGEVTYPNGANVKGTYTTGQLKIPNYKFVRMDDGTATGAKSLSAKGTLTKAGDNGTVIYVYDHDVVPVNPTNPQTPGTPINPDNPHGPKWPEGTDKSSVTQTVIRTVNYLDKQTDKAVAKQITEQVTYNRTAIVDKVTGQIIGYSTTGGDTVDQTDGDKAWTAVDNKSDWDFVTSPDLSSKGWSQ
ncbi:hypothetical protein lhe_0256 [Lactobacillus helveticus CNRZ32]|nr:hypothetical protein lhe_0256 [Lactobacillus helveticus CNRZ32]